MRADKGATASFLKAVAHLMIYIETDSPQFRKCLRVIAAQWALESNFGNSELAKSFRNFSGLKFRKAVAHVCDRKADYTDWEKESDAYLWPESEQNFVEVYFEFIARRVYQGFDKKLPSPTKFIKHIADCGFCGAISGVSKKDYSDPDEYRKAVHDEYFHRVTDLALSDKLNNVILLASELILP